MTAPGACLKSQLLRGMRGRRNHNRKQTKKSHWQCLWCNSKHLETVFFFLRCQPQGCRDAAIQVASFQKERRCSQLSKTNLKNMKHLDLFVIRKQRTKRILLVFIKPQQNRPYFIACFMGLETPEMAPCKNTLEMETQSRLVIKATCLDSSGLSASCVWKTSQIAVGGSL